MAMLASWHQRINGMYHNSNNNSNNTINEIMARGEMAINNGNIGENSSIISNGVAKSRISYQRK
jgi:hypothetical protein